MDDIYNPNHPSPPARILQREAALEDAAAAAKEWAARIKKATDDWAALKNDPAALVNQSHGSGTWSRGYHLANIEDADLHVLSILEDV